MSARRERSGEAGWQRVADELKSRPPESPGAFARERMARRIEAARDPRSMTYRRAVPIALAGAVMAAAAAAILVAWRTRSSGATDESSARIAVVSFEGAGGATAEIAQGAELRTAPGLVAVTQIAGARLTAEGASAMRLASLDPRDVRVVLRSGSVRVAFHPSTEGDRVTISTRDAEVAVVGTVFRVEANAEATRVSVSEGRVRVTDRHGRRDDATPGHDVVVRRGAIAAAGSFEPARSINPPSERTDQAPSVAPLAARAAGEAVGASAVGPESGASDPTRANDRAESTRSRASPTTTVGRAADVERARLAATPSLAPREGETQPTMPDSRARLVAARSLLERGQHGPARSELRAIGASSGPVGVRVEAWTLLAESHQSTGDARTAVGLYDRAAALGRGTASGANARFAQARLLDRRLGDPAGARAAYRRYLSETPRGALRRSAIEALCRLGDADACASRAETEPAP